MEFLSFEEALSLWRKGNGWRNSPHLLRAVVNNRCVHCNLFMGKEHDFSECYAQSHGLKMLCGESLYKFSLPTQEEIYNV